MIGSGGITVGGCADVQVNYNYRVRFTIGNVAYDCRQARIGILDKVAVKRIRVINEAGTIMYTDTFNRQWNEDDLCTLSVAKSNALAYWNEQLENLKDLVMDCDGS